MTMIVETRKEPLRKVSLPAFVVALLISTACQGVGPSAPTFGTVQVNVLPVQNIPSEPPPTYSVVDPFPRGGEAVSMLGNISFQQMRSSLAKVKMSQDLRTFLINRSPGLTWIGVKNSTLSKGDMSRLARLGLKFFKHTHLFFKKEDTAIVSRDIRPHLGIWRRLKLSRAAFLKQKEQSLQIKCTYRSALTGTLRQGQGYPITLGGLRQSIGDFSWPSRTHDDVTVASVLRDKSLAAHHRSCAKKLLKRAGVSLNFEGLRSANGEAISLAIQKAKYRKNFFLRFLGVRGKTYKNKRVAMQVNRKKDLQANEQAFAPLLPKSLLGRMLLRLTTAPAA